MRYTLKPVVVIKSSKTLQATEMESFGRRGKKSDRDKIGTRFFSLSLSFFLFSLMVVRGVVFSHGDYCCPTKALLLSETRYPLWGTGVLFFFWIGSIFGFFFKFFFLTQPEHCEQFILIRFDNPRSGGVGNAELNQIFNKLNRCGWWCKVTTNRRLMRLMEHFTNLWEIITL